jgi:hypothetical protein
MSTIPQLGGFHNFDKLSSCELFDNLFFSWFGEFGNNNWLFSHLAKIDSLIYTWYYDVQMGRNCELKVEWRESTFLPAQNIIQKSMLHNYRKKIEGEMLKCL